jgi:hypothetical protein
MAKDKEIKSEKEMNNRIKNEDKTMSVINDLLVSTTKEEFEKLGYEEVEGYAGVYATGKKYGSGAKEDRFSIKIEGQHESFYVKKIQLGTKRMQSDINVDFKENQVEIEYKVTEAGFFRGVDEEKIPFSFSKNILIKNEDVKKDNKELKDFFKYAAKKEIGYLTSTKLGVDDMLTKSTTSTVNENTMEKLTIKSLFEEGKDKEDTKQNIDKVKDANTLAAKDVHPKSSKMEKGKHLFFDDEKDSKKDKKTVEERDEELKEITTAGPAGAGAGRYDTPFAFKATAYSKGKKYKRPKVDKNYNIVPETKGNSDGFWQVVKVDPNYHPLGMPFVKPGSKEEVDATLKGDKNKLKRMGLKEGEEKNETTTPEVKLNLDLTKKKIFSEAENKALGINKRYLVTEKTTEEYLQDRWKKLTAFKLNESVKEAEENSAIFDELPKNLDNSLTKLVTESFLGQDNSTRQKDVVKDEDTIEIEKPGSLFNVSYLFYKKDYLNESAKFILDLNSRVFVPNPNVK